MEIRGFYTQRLKEGLRLEKKFYLVKTKINF